MRGFRSLTVSLCAAALATVSLAAAKGKEKEGDPAKGKVVFEQCQMCHNADSTEKKMGPGLKGLFKRDKLPASGKKVTEQNVRAQIDAGGNGMPSYKDMLSQQEKDDLIAYLKTI